MFALDDALMLVIERGRIMSAQPPGGGMLACLGKRDVVLAVAERHGKRLSVAAYNGPESLVISGELAAIEALKQEVEREGVTTQALRVSHAFHSAMMEGALDPFEAVARKVPHAVPRIPLISNLTGQPFADGEAPSPAYWRRQLREAVQFSTAAQTAQALGCDAFIEIGPASSLLTLARLATGGPADAVWLPSLRRGADDWTIVLDSLAKLHERGATIDWEGFDRDYPRRTTSLPHYPFERVRFWLEEPAPRPSPNGVNGHNGVKHHAPNGTPSNGVSHDASTVVELLREQSIALRRISESLGNGATPANGHAAKPADPSGFVVQTISHICGFPLDRIANESRLGSDLGFDSLMAMELHHKLAGIYPGLVGTERHLLAQDVTVADVLRLLREHVAGAPVVAAAPVAVAEALEPQVAKFSEDDAHIERWPELYVLEERAMDIALRNENNPYTRTRSGFNTARSESSGKPVLNFAAFNYLGLSNHPQVREEAKRAIDAYGTGCSATPLLFGETPIHHELEAAIATFLGTEDAIVFPGGHATNVAVVGHLYGPQDLIIHDQLIHDSTIRGAILSGASRRMFRHSDWEDLDRILTATRSRFRRVLIVLEGTYSQDGDIPPLPQFIAIKKKHAAQLMIDEAHSLGVVGPTGRGIGEHFGVEREDVDLWMGTLSKALGSCGGYIAGKGAMVRYLRFTTPLFIFATGITPGDAAAARASLRVLSAEPERVKRLQHLARTFVAGARERGLETGVAGPSAIVPIILGDWHRTISASNTLHERGINAMPIGHPAVAKDACRLRFFINFEHTEAQLRSALDAVAEVTGTPRPNGAATQKGTASMIQTSKSSSPDVLVAGATGFIGSRLTEMLVDKGARVRVLVRPGTDRRRLAPLGVELVEGALEDTASLRRAVDGIRTIYNCTGLSTDWARWSAFEQTNVTGVKNLLEAAASGGSAERFLHLSTTDVYGYPVKACDETVEPRDVGLPYNRSKLLGEQAVLECHKQTGLPVTIVRPVTVYGPRSKDWVIEIGKLLRTGKMMFVDGGSSCAGFLYIDNAVDGIIAAATSARTNGLVYNLRDGSNETWRDYVDALAAGMKAKPVRKSMSSRLALGIARASEAVYGGLRVRARPLLTRHAVYLMSRDQGYGIDRARQDLAFTPSVDFDAGMAATLRWLESDEGRASVPS
ncbi:MAG: aminotransferase class I/II-fold pyridoxal phosphate-dependent enzyme [Kofleriaceae bacterium]